MLHLVLVFLHVTSAMAIVAGLGVEGLVLVQSRAARTSDQLRAALANSRYAQRAGGLGMLGVLVTGIILATAYWHWQGAWMGMAFLTIIALALVGGLMTGRPMARLLRSPAGAVGTSEIANAQGVLAMSYMIRLALFLGIVFLMTTKPVSGLAALLVVLVAGALGVLAGLPARRVRPAHV